MFTEESNNINCSLLAHLTFIKLKSGCSHELSIMFCHHHWHCNDCSYCLRTVLLVYSHEILGQYHLYFFEWQPFFLFSFSNLSAMMVNHRAFIFSRIFLLRVSTHKEPGYHDLHSQTYGHFFSICHLDFLIYTYVSKLYMKLNLFSLRFMLY